MFKKYSNLLGIKGKYYLKKMSKIEFNSENKLGNGIGFVNGDGEKGIVMLQEWWYFIFLSKGVLKMGF
jgi:hypothetical protein